jgi:hypothetical protein
MTPSLRGSTIAPAGFETSDPSTIAHGGLSKNEPRKAPVKAAGSGYVGGGLC